MVFAREHREGKMAWENIDERLKRALSVKISFPVGTMWLPDSQLSIDDWLTSIAQTDEELQELNIPRIQFLQNRWPMDPLLELEWDDGLSSRRVILAMYVGHRVYILFSDWCEYHVIAALEPSDKPSLYKAVVGKLLENRSFVRVPPRHIKNRRPDLLPDLLATREYCEKAEPAEHGVVPDAFRPHEIWKDFLSDILGGWVGKWLDLPEIGFWHEDMPQSISRTNEGTILMKYEASNSGKQEDERGKKKEDQITPTQNRTDEERKRAS